jgi:hypothetical protein
MQTEGHHKETVPQVGLAFLFVTENSGTVKPLSIVPACNVFMQQSFIFSGPCTLPIYITFLELSFSHIRLLFVPSEVMDRGFTAATSFRWVKMQ